MTEYTPSDDDVRARASMAPPGHSIESVRGRQRAEFDRWLRAHDARVRRDAAANALYEVATDIDNYDDYLMVHNRAKRIEETP